MDEDFDDRRLQRPSQTAAAVVPETKGGSSAAHSPYETACSIWR